MPSSIRESGFADLAPIAELSAFARRRPLWRGTALRGVAGKFGMACVVLTLSAAVLGPLLAPHDPFAITGGSLVPPSAGHWMGTDALGRDVLSGVLYGARTSLVIASAVSTIALFVGYAIFIAATDGAEKALIAELAPKAQLGTAFGWFHLVSGLMLLPASALFGWLWTRVNPTVAFMVSASMSLLAAGLLWRTLIAGGHTPNSAQ